MTARGGPGRVWWTIPPWMGFAVVMCNAVYLLNAVTRDHYGESVMFAVFIAWGSYCWLGAEGD